MRLARDAELVVGLAESGTCRSLLSLVLSAFCDRVDSETIGTKRLGWQRGVRVCCRLAEGDRVAASLQVSMI